jgi:hypothetical protein
MSEPEACFEQRSTLIEAGALTQGTHRTTETNNRRSHSNGVVSWNE